MAALGAVLVGILVMGPTLIIELPMDSSPGAGGGQPEVQPLQIALDDVVVERINDRSASIEVAFTVYNPNARAVMVQTLSYQLFETSLYSDTLPLLGGQMGSRPGGMVEFGSSYYTLLADSSITLRETTQISNPGQSSLWSALEEDTASWLVKGDMFYNLSSMTSGQENILHFELTH